MEQNTHNDIIFIKARISLKTTAEGGRLDPIRTGYRPNHVFEKSKSGKILDTCIGEIQFDDQEFIQLGETKIVTVMFLRSKNLEKYLCIGQKWWIHEGQRFVGDGEILKL